MISLDFLFSALAVFNTRQLLHFTVKLLDFPIPILDQDRNKNASPFLLDLFMIKRLRKSYLLAMLPIHPFMVCKSL
jgi:hypothetical protein